MNTTRKRDVDKYVKNHGKYRLLNMKDGCSNRVTELVPSTSYTQTTYVCEYTNTVHHWVYLEWIVRLKKYELIEGRTFRLNDN